jgi:hypothetical protein
VQLPVTAGRPLRTDTISGVFPSVALPSPRKSFMRYLVFILSCAFVLLVTLFSTLLGFAQAKNLGKITRHISDPSGGSIASATVALMDGQRVIKLNDVPPGRYRVRVTAKGFASKESPLFDLTTTQSKVLSLTLRVESVKEQIDVNSESPGTLNTEKDANAGGGVLTGKQLCALPDDLEDLQADLRALAGPGSGSGRPAVHRGRLHRSVTASQRIDFLNLTASSHRHAQICPRSFSSVFVAAHLEKKRCWPLAMAGGAPLTFGQGATDLSRCVTLTAAPCRFRVQSSKISPLYSSASLRLICSPSVARPLHF